MKYDPQIHHRQSIRLKGHDYASGGIYFITICAHRNAGKIFDPRPVRKMIGQIWKSLPDRFPCAAVRAPFMDAPPAPSDTHEEHPYATIMPDHFHALIKIHPGDKSLGKIIGAFKSLVVHEYIAGVKRGEFARFSGKIWHRNYYERIIRNADDLRRTAEYIRLNPVKLQFQIDGIPAIGNPALWELPTLGLLASGGGSRTGSLHGRPSSSLHGCPSSSLHGQFTAHALLSGCHSDLEEQLARQNNLPLIWMPAVAPDSIGFSDWQLQRLEAGTLLILCPFSDTHTTRENALKRNRLIAEQCNQLWIPAARKGGSLEALKKEFKNKEIRQ